MKKELYVCILFFLFTGTVRGQQLADIKVKRVYDNQNLSLVLVDLEITYRFRFKVDKSLINGLKVTASLRNTTLKDALETLFNQTGLTFKFNDEDRTVTIFESRKSPDGLPNANAPSRADFTLSGVVRDKLTGETLPFATVAIAGTSSGTETNVDGHFTLFAVPSDTCRLTVSYLGYQTLEFQLTPDLDISAVSLGLSAKSVALDQVLVSSVKDDQMINASTGISRINMTPEILSALPNYGERDVFRSLQLLPGVSGSNESSSGLFVRGGTPDQNLILFDGFTVYHVDHLFGFFSAFNANAIKDIQLYKGGFDSEFGGRLSSVVEMTGKDGNSQNFGAGAGLSLLSYNGYIEGPFAEGKGTFLVAGRRSFQSNFYSNLFDAFAGSNQAEQAAEVPRPGRGGLSAQQATRPNSFFYDLNAKVTYRLSDRDIFSFSVYNGEDDLDNSRNVDSNTLGGNFAGRLGGTPGGSISNFTFINETTDLSNWGNLSSSLRYSRKWSDRFYTRTNISYSNYFSDRDRTNSVEVTREDTTILRNTGSIESNDLQDFTVKVDNEWKLSNDNLIDFGLQFTRNDIKYDFVQNDTLSVISRDNYGSSFATYLQDKWTIRDRLILKGGIRSTYYSPTSTLYWEPRASVTYFLNDRIKLKGAYSKHYQFANRIVREDIQQGSRDFWLLSDDVQIPIGSAIHRIAGVSYESGDYLFDLEAYYKDLSGLTEYSSRIQPTGNGINRRLTYEESFYSGTGVAQGLELLLQKKTGRFNGWISYTLGQVKYNFDAFGSEPFFANQDQTHELKTVFNYKLKRWDFASTFVFSTGRPYTAPTGYYEIELLDGSSEAYFEVSQKNALRLPDYHRLDLSATYNFNIGKSNLKTGLSLINLYGRKNVWYKEYEVIEGELLVTDVSLIDFTPSLFISWNLN